MEPFQFEPNLYSDWLTMIPPLWQPLSKEKVDPILSLCDKLFSCYLTNITYYDDADE
jgi:hypothetical protein